MDLNHPPTTNNDKIATRLDQAGVKPTANRILVLRYLLGSRQPLSLLELEAHLETLDKSSISRVLSALHTHGLVHAIEDGRGVVKYEVCHAEGECSVNDMHAHFYCEKCGEIFCLREVAAPVVTMPKGFRLHSINYMLKGLCPACAAKE